MEKVTCPAKEPEDNQDWAERVLEEFKESGIITFPNGRVVAFGPADITRMIQFMLSRQARRRPQALAKPEDFRLRKTTGEAE